MIKFSCRDVALLRTKSRSVGWLVYWGCFEREKDKFCLAGFCAVLCYETWKKQLGVKRLCHLREIMHPSMDFFSFFFFSTFRAVSSIRTHGCRGYSWE